MAGRRKAPCRCRLLGTVALLLALALALLAVPPVAGQADPPSYSQRPGSRGNPKQQADAPPKQTWSNNPQGSKVAAAASGLLDQWSTWFDKKFGKFTRDPRHHEGMKGAALMTILIIFMFVPQMFFKAAVPKDQRGVKFDPNRRKPLSRPSPAAAKAAAAAAAAAEPKPGKKKLKVPVGEKKKEPAQKTAAQKKKE